MTIPVAKAEAPIVPTVSTAPEPPKTVPVALLPALVPICSCESTGRPDRTPQQFDSEGNVLHGKQHYPDTGMCQLNANAWASKALSMGWDINTSQGNIHMANWIYQQSGTAPWSSSSACWE